MAHWSPLVSHHRPFQPTYAHPGAQPVSYLISSVPPASWPAHAALPTVTASTQSMGTVSSHLAVCATSASRMYAPSHPLSRTSVTALPLPLSGCQPVMKPSAAPLPSAELCNRQSWLAPKVMQASVLARSVSSCKSAPTFRQTANWRLHRAEPTHHARPLTCARVTELHLVSRRSRAFSHPPALCCAKNLANASHTATAARAGCVTCKRSHQQRCAERVLNGRWRWGHAQEQPAKHVR